MTVDHVQSLNDPPVQDLNNEIGLHAARRENPAVDTQGVGNLQLGPVTARTC